METCGKYANPATVHIGGVSSGYELNKATRLVCTSVLPFCLVIQLITKPNLTLISLQTLFFVDLLDSPNNTTKVNNYVKRLNKYL